jgi:hypothetical protein
MNDLTAATSSGFPCEPPWTLGPVKKPVLLLADQRYEAIPLKLIPAAS